MCSQLPANVNHHKTDCGTPGQCQCHRLDGPNILHVCGQCVGGHDGEHGELLDPGIPCQVDPVHAVNCVDNPVVACDAPRETETHAAQVAGTQGRV